MKGIQAMRQDWSKLACESSRHFATPPLVSRETTSEKRGQIFRIDDDYPDLGSASDWLKKFSANQKHYQDLGSDASSV